jgi:hypothetical protein
MAAASSCGTVELRALLAWFAQLQHGRVFVLSAPQAYPEADRLFGKVSYLFVFTGSPGRIRNGELSHCPP